MNWDAAGITLLLASLCMSRADTLLREDHPERVGWRLFTGAAGSVMTLGSIACFWVAIT